MKAERGDEALRRFRISSPGADYFLTVNLADKNGPNLTPVARHAVRAEIEAIENSGHWHVRGAVIMPDHLHLLATLGPSLPISRAVARLKSKTRAALAAANTCWQDNYYEHRLRPHEDVGKVLLYIFLNPYRAALIPAAEQYPWFWLGHAEKEWFEPGLSDGRPFAEWLR